MDIRPSRYSRRNTSGSALRIGVVAGLTGLVGIPACFAQNPALPELPPVKYEGTFYDEDTAMLNMLKDPEFIKPWARVLHMLGFAWVGGNNSRYVGEDLGYTRIPRPANPDPSTRGTSARFVVRGNYSSAGYPGYRRNETSKMDFGNVRWVLDGRGVSMGKPEFAQPRLVNYMEFTVCNRSDAMQTSQAMINYKKVESESKTVGATVSGGIKLETKFSGAIPFTVEGGTSMAVSVEAGGNWSDTSVRTNESFTQFNQTLNVPSKRMQRVRLNMFEMETRVPYTAYMYPKYEMTMVGFMRWEWNGHQFHPKDRPTFYVPLGTSNVMDSAEKEMTAIYVTPELGRWDWPDIIRKYGDANVRDALAKIKRKYLHRFEGVWTAKTSTDVQAVLQPDEPLREASCSRILTDGTVEAKSPAPGLAGGTVRRIKVLPMPSKPSSVSPFGRI